MGCGGGTRSDLLVFARLDEGSSPAKVTVSDAELEAINLHGHAFHPDWHDTREPASNYLAPPNSVCGSCCQRQGMGCRSYRVFCSAR